MDDNHQLMCDFDAESLVCRKCGYLARRLPTFRECRPPPQKPWRPVMVGDMVEKALSSVGITQERVSAAVGDCGCQQRKGWLNDAGVAVQVGVRNAAIAARDFFVGETG